ncbi:hypothetical protein CN692_25540 [Bacillus sp. AFS002410]|uniref:tetratricopeptide repeat protein n=1 Tax=Bacillus sp. AFS002410 TaxID=2033481 RepID=UPI000BF08C5F|nr:hypothetical protein [Bacillus sp. AFS002410]PEJ46668.1 hypothetical protein CN692_25540 [Bacillus sp. AFS002410]
MNTNQKAIDLFEKNEYKEAFELFQKAVKESRNIQSLNNLAWFYLYEEEDDDTALELIKETISLNPSSYFPYNIISEIYIGQKKWKLASCMLQKSISIQPSYEALRNYAITNYHLGNLEEAAELFLKVAGNSDHMLYCYVKCLIELGRKSEAKEKLKEFDEEADDFDGVVELAELYLELECYEEAVHYFEKGWLEYSKGPYWISRFIYSLFKANNITRINEVINESIKEKIEEIQDATEESIEENWTENDKAEYIKHLNEEKATYENMVELIISGHKPLITFEPASTGSCYLFGCKQHKHPEHQE